MANTSAIWQQAAHTTDQLSSPSCSTRAIQKSLTLNEIFLSFPEKSQKNGQLTEKLQDRKIKRTRQKKREKKKEKKKKRGDRKGESNDSPEIPDRRVTSDIPGLPSGASWLEQGCFPVYYDVNFSFGIQFLVHLKISIFILDCEFPVHAKCRFLQKARENKLLVHFVYRQFSDY